MTKKNLDEIKIVLLLLTILNAFAYGFVLINKLEKNEQITTRKVDSLQHKIDSIDTVIDNIPFTYSDSVRTKFFKDYQKFRKN